MNKKRTSLPWAPKKETVQFQRTESKYQQNQKFYNSKAWRSLRKTYIEEHPLCAVSYATGRLAAGEVIDHIIPINEGGARLDRRNLMTLTNTWHNKKSGMERHKKILVEWEIVDGEKIPVNRNEIIEILTDES